MLLDPVETTAQLVAIPSVNPMGRDAAGPEFFEGRLTDHLEGLFARLGLPTLRQPVAPGRENILARLDGTIPPDRGGAVLLLDAHQDTVPVEGMTIEPFRPEVRDGRLHGRGACDTKGSMAAMLSAVARLAESPPPDMPTVILACAVNEEFGFTGAASLAGLWTDPPAGARFISRRPDAAIVGEPTGLDVVVAHKGAVRWTCRTHGKAGHSSNPDAGANAIYRMARALAVFERYQAEGVGHAPRHPLCGGATLSVGTIRGGISVNTIPDLCEIEIDRRVPPGESPEDAYRHVLDFFARHWREPFDVEHMPPALVLPPLSDDANGPLGQSLADAVEAVIGRCCTIGEPYGTHAAIYAAAGVPSVVFGPGYLEQAHTRDEWVPIEHLEQAAEVLYRFVSQGGVAPRGEGRP
ncbi:MAG: M20 family metallopeptidase [Pirellulales bacterium]|nr:M20 family metallopeptidase [Pirellulales bacterium]